VNPGRRSFLRLVLVGGAGLAVGLGGSVAVDRSLRQRLYWYARGMEARLLRPASLVALATCPSYSDDVAECVRLAWQQAGATSASGRRVLVKPNLIDLIDGHPVTTAPEVVLAVVDLMLAQGAREVVVGDGPGFRRDALSVARIAGLAAGLKARGVPFVDLNFNDPRPVPSPADWFPGASKLWLPRAVREADLIVSVPKMKTHHWAGASLSMKNLFGTLPGCRYGWPKNMLHVNGINRSIIGLLQATTGLAPVVAVVDGITGMEGDGPLYGQPVPHGVITVSGDPVAADAACARLMGLTATDAWHIEAAGRFGLGQAHKYDLVGADAQALQRSYLLPPTL
jgi:uncharacterized protein (DUF362 family)